MMMLMMQMMMTTTTAMMMTMIFSPRNEINIINEKYSTVSLRDNYHFITGMNIFVAFFVLLLLLSDSTPPAASAIPLIGLYIFHTCLY